MSTETAAIVGITVMLAQGLIELTKYLVGKLADNKEEKLTPEQHNMLKSLYDLHMRYDSDGTPIWYVPRSWNETQKEIAEKLYGVSETQNKTLSIIERLEKRLDNLPGG